MKFILALAVLFLAAKAVEYETFTDTTIQWAPEPQHILQSNPSKVPRSVDVKVKFQQAFSRVPKVLIATEVLDWEGGAFPVYYQIAVTKVTTKDFTYTVTVNFARQFYTVRVRWLAIIDSHIQFKYLDFKTPDLAVGDFDEESNNVQSFDFTWDYPFDEAPNANAFLLGGNIIDGDVELSVTLDSISETGGNVNIGTSLAHCQWAAVVIVGAPTEFSISSFVGDNLGNDGDNWNTPDGQRREQEYVIDLSGYDDSIVTDGLSFQGISTFDVAHQ